MYTTEYKCRVITPMLIHGSDTKTAELRSPSIKGAMRFWWRAVNASLDNNCLKEREQIIFGGVKNNALKSSFSISVELDEKKKTGLFNPTPHKNCGYRISGFGVGTEFTVRFSANNIVINKICDNGEAECICGNERLKEVENIFQLMALCGGLGMRSRRGFGAFSIIKKNREEYCESVKLRDIQSLIQKVRKDSNALDCAENISVERDKVICSDSYFKTGLMSVQLGNSYNKVSELLESVGECSHNARNIKTYNDIREKDINNALGHIRGGRLASPVIVSAIETKNKRYRLIITTLCSVDNSFKSADLKPDEKLKRIQRIQKNFTANLT